MYFLRLVLPLQLTRLSSWRPVLTPSWHLVNFPVGVMLTILKSFFKYSSHPLRGPRVHLPECSRVDDLGLVPREPAHEAEVAPLLGGRAVGGGLPGVVFGLPLRVSVFKGLWLSFFSTLYL